MRLSRLYFHFKISSQAIDFVFVSVIEDFTKPSIEMLLNYSFVESAFKEFLTCPEGEGMIDKRISKEDFL